MAASWGTNAVIIMRFLCIWDHQSDLVCYEAWHLTYCTVLYSSPVIFYATGILSTQRASGHLFISLANIFFALTTTWKSHFRMVLKATSACMYMRQFTTLIRPYWHLMTRVWHCCSVVILWPRLCWTSQLPHWGCFHKHPQSMFIENVREN